ncbi:MAG TPA: D-2-hydroxyacid dehydrogenase [Blastocatellia bacterium]
MLSQGRERTTVLVLMAPDDKNAAPFRKEIENDTNLSGAVDIRFAAPADAIEVIRDAEVVECINLSADLLAAAPKLRWVSFWSAGLDKRITPEIEAHGLMVTSASGVHGPNIAEQVMAYMLMFTRQMPLFIRAQENREWAHGTGAGFQELAGKTLGITGLGHIGSTLGARAHAFGMRVVATKRDLSRSRDDWASGVFVPEALYAAADLPKMLAESDHVCIAVPYTRETHHLFNAAMFAHMKPAAYLYNIARGPIVDEQALVAALRSGRLRGAGLDVFETEPLAQDSPLWSMGNVIITPHVAGFTPYYFERAAKLFAANLERYIQGLPLRNLYVAARGY